MKITSKVTKQQVARFAVVLACLGIAVLAFAIPPNQLLRKGDSPVITGACCFSWGESVTVTEPAQITPVVVTWNTGYLSTVPYKVGIAVNGHPCQVSDNFVFDISGSIGRSRTFQWVVLPSDGLIKGANTFTLCGGGAKGTDSVTLGFRTLAVTISK
jgi:hypothetical protein